MIIKWKWSKSAMRLRGSWNSIRMSIKLTSRIRKEHISKKDYKIKPIQATNQWKKDRTNSEIWNIALHQGMFSAPRVSIEIKKGIAFSHHRFESANRWCKLKCQSISHKNRKHWISGFSMKKSSILEKTSISSTCSSECISFQILTKASRKCRCIISWQVPSKIC